MTRLLALAMVVVGTLACAVDLFVGRSELYVPGFLLILGGAAVGGMARDRGARDARE